MILPLGTKVWTQFWVLLLGKGSETNTSGWRPGMPLGILKCIGQLPAKKNYWASDTQTWRLRSPGCRARPGLSSRNLSLHGPALSRAQLEAFISPDIETQKCKMISLDVPYLFPLALSFVLMQLYFNLGDFERKAGFKACPEQWKVCEQRPWPP